MTEIEKITTKRLALYSGRTHPELAFEVAANLGMDLGEVKIVEFANGEIKPRYAESVRGSDVFVMQSHFGTSDSESGTGHSVNDSLMEQLIMIDAAKRASAKRITAVCPYYGYSRQDRKVQGPRADHRPAGRRLLPHGRRRPRSSRSTCTPGRSRASSTDRSTTSPRCRC